MIGVLAVIGILAALLIPKIFEAINNARINSAAVSIASVKTALADHYAKYGSLISSNGTTVTMPVANFDKILVSEGFMDKALSLKIADPVNTGVQLVSLSGITNGQSVSATSYTFDLADTGATNFVVGSAAVVVGLTNVLEADAKALNDLIDGPALGVPLGTSAGDLAGRVKYGGPDASGLVTMMIYVTHR